jgi:hypothetical protein
VNALLKQARAISPMPTGPIVKPLVRKTDQMPRKITLAEDIEFRWYLVQFLRDFRSGAKFGDSPSGEALRLARLTPAAANLEMPIAPSARGRRSSTPPAPGRNRVARHAGRAVPEFRVPPFIAAVSAGHGEATAAAS